MSKALLISRAFCFNKKGCDILARWKRKPGKTKRAPKPKEPRIDRSRATFEQAFYNRVGQRPDAFIKSKLEAGSDLSSTKYLYEITAAAIAQQYHCLERDFEEYYTPICPKEPRMKNVITYNKLVRDRIPEIIRASGKQCSVDVLENTAYINMLDAKLQEELNEYQQSKSLEELADLLEVMGAVVRARGYTWDDLTRVRKKKRDERGGFDQRILLKDVFEE